MSKNKVMQGSLLMMALMSSVVTTSAIAAFTLNGTRFIYEEGKKSISLEVSNSTKEAYGGQVWIDNVSQNNANVYFVPSPPFFKVEAGRKQVLRLINANPALPLDRESIFLINLQEIPPKPKQTDGSMIAIAMNTQVKLIYRPKALLKGRNEAEKQLTAIQRDGSVWLKNTTPYYFAVTKLKVNGKITDISKAQQRGLAMLAPFSEADTGLKHNGKLAVVAINDWGGEQEYEVN